MTTWFSDTCSCIIDVDFNSPGQQMTGWTHKCEIHKDLPDASLKGQMIAQNNIYKIPNNGNKAERNANNAAKRTEFNRINALGPGVWNN